MTSRLSPTDAVLACAAAETRAELHKARLELIETGAGMMRDLDTAGLVSGDGTAGQALLGGTGSPYRDSCAARSHRIQTRLFATLAEEHRS